MPIRPVFVPNTKAKSEEVNRIWSKDWTTWTPGFTGFSVNPTTSYALYAIFGNLAFVAYKSSADGTSNTNAFTITGLPVTPLYNQSFPLTAAVNGGAVINTGAVYATASSTTLDLYTTHAGGGWTTSLGKGAGWLFLQIILAP